MNCTTYKQLILFYMHSNKDFVVLPLKTKNCIFPKADSKKKQKKKEKGNATNTFFTSISLVLSNEKKSNNPLNLQNCIPSKVCCLSNLRKCSPFTVNQKRRVYLLQNSCKGHPTTRNDD